MGCDIHSFVEVKENGKWRHYDWREEFQQGEYDDGSPKYDYSRMFDSPFFIGRNYDLFAILANVRNGRGFAGIATGTGFKPISTPRGLPNDVTIEVKSESDRWGVDGHSHSYLILSELLGYDYDNQFTIQFGVVGEEGYKDFKQNGHPSYYSGGIWGKRVEMISNEEMEQLLNGSFEKILDKEYYTRVQWKESYRESVGLHWFNMLDALSKLGQPENVRLVFWFDN